MEPVPSHGVRDLEALHAIAPFGLLVDHIQNELDRVGTLGVVTLLPTPVCPKTKLSARKAWPKGPARTEWHAMTSTGRVVAAGKTGADGVADLIVSDEPAGLIIVRFATGEVAKCLVQH